MQYQKSVVVSAHGDTNWRQHSLQILQTKNAEGIEECEYYGHMDNFAGVHSAMLAYFSGRLPKTQFRMEVTYGEETDMEGAREVAATLRPADIVIVIDVTGTSTTKDIVIEKCYNRSMRKFIKKVLEAQTDPKISFDIYADCPDQICSQDETDVYRKKTDFCFFLGIPVRGGDYNDGPVYCWKRSIDATAAAVIALTNAFVDKFDTLSHLPRLTAKSSSSAGDQDAAEAEEISSFDIFAD